MKVSSVLIAGASLLVAAWPVPTAAQERVSSVTLEDGAGDAWMWTPVDQEFVPTDRAEVDVVRATVRHRGKAVVATMRFGDLAQVGEEQSFRVEITTPKRWYGSNATVSPGDWDGRLRLIDYAQERYVNCAHDAVTVDYDRDTVRIRVPRGCIGRPEWVRLTMSNEAFIDGDFYGDNPHTRVVDSTTTRRLYRATA